MSSNTVFGRDDSGTPVAASLRGRLEGLYVVGKQGMGKTTLLLNLVTQDLKDGRGVAVLDPHGDLTLDVLSILPPERQGGVALLDLQDREHPFGLDLFACPDGDEMVAAERVVGTFKQAWGDSSWGARLEDLLRNLALAFVEVGGLALPDALPMLTDDGFRRRVVAKLANPIVRDFWEREYDGWSGGTRAQAIGPVLNKLRAFLAVPLLRRVVAVPGSGPDFGELIERRGVLLVRLDPRLVEASSLLGATIVHRVLEAALGRKDIPPAKRHPFMLYADEFQLFATSDFGRLLQEARKFGVATTLAHQVRAQLPTDLKAFTVASGGLACFALSPEDARELSRQFAPRSPVSRATSTPTPITWIAANGHPNPSLVRAAREVETILNTFQVRQFAEIRERHREPVLPAFKEIYAGYRRCLEDHVYRGVHQPGLSPRSWDPDLRALMTKWQDLASPLIADLTIILSGLRAELERERGLPTSPEGLTALEHYRCVVRLRQETRTIEALVRPDQVVDPAAAADVHAVFAGKTPIGQAGKRAALVRAASRRRYCPPEPKRQDVSPSPAEEEDAIFYYEPRQPPPGWDPD